MILFAPEIREMRRKMETVRQKLPIFDLSLQTERGERMENVRVGAAKPSAARNESWSAAFVVPCRERKNNSSFRTQALFRSISILAELTAVSNSKLVRSQKIGSCYGKRFVARERETFVSIQRKTLRWTFFGPGMT